MGKRGRKFLDDVSKQAMAEGRAKAREAKKMAQEALQSNVMLKPEFWATVAPETVLGVRKAMDEATKLAAQKIVDDLRAKLAEAEKAVQF